MDGWIPIPDQSINIEILRKRQRARGLGNTSQPIRLDDVTLRVDMHARHGVVELHVGLADVAAVSDGLDAFAQVVGVDCAGVDGGLGDEDYGGRGEESLFVDVLVWFGS